MNSESSQIAQWLAEPLSAEVKTSVQRLASLPGVRRVALMPDIHLAEQVCVGVVMASQELVYPQAVGGDVGCGMAAARLSCSADLLRNERRALRLLAALGDAVPSNRRHRQQLLALPAQCHPDLLKSQGLRSAATRDGVVQFATLGRGNHFLEFQADDEEELWLMVHSGSRAMGQAIARAYATPSLQGLPASEPLARNFLADSQWAVAYAAASRYAMLEAACAVAGEIVGREIEPLDVVDCCHNFVRLEQHFGQDLWVHRKGAMSAGEGESGIIPGSMGTCSYHVTGRGNADSLRSSSHGAGRAMSRGEARRRIALRELRREMDGVWFDERLGDLLREEAPRAYRDIGAVMRAQPQLTRIIRRLRPVLSYKGA